jgi:hypothetical protein
LAADGVSAGAEEIEAAGAPEGRDSAEGRTNAEAGSSTTSDSRGFASSEPLRTVATPIYCDAPQSDAWTLYLGKHYRRGLINSTDSSFID